RLEGRQRRSPQARRGGAREGDRRNRGASYGAVRLLQPDPDRAARTTCEILRAAEGTGKARKRRPPDRSPVDLDGLDILNPEAHERPGVVLAVPGELIGRHSARGRTWVVHAVEDDTVLQELSTSESSGSNRARAWEGVRQ